MLVLALFVFLCIQLFELVNRHPTSKAVFLWNWMRSS